jgi:nucleotide-binding universal stress UspA family protein
MPGILVGVDGSAHAQRALEWAIKEAALRHTSLTVLTVHQAVAGFWGGTLHYAQDESLTDQAREAAQAATDKTLASLPDQHPESVTVKAVNGLPAEELINASADADLVVLGSRGEGGFARMVMGSVSTQVVHHAHCPAVVLPA